MYPSEECVEEPRTIYKRYCCYVLRVTIKNSTTDTKFFVPLELVKTSKSSQLLCSLKYNGPPAIWHESFLIAEGKWTKLKGDKGRLMATGSTLNIVIAEFK